jgi:hypothetical protein
VSDWDSAPGSSGDWPPVVPGTPQGDDVTNVTNSVAVPDLSITTDKLAAGAVTDDKVTSVGVAKLVGVFIKVYRSTDQTIATGNTGEDITFNTVTFNQGFAAPAATFTTVAIPVTGIWLLTASVQWANLDTGGRASTFYINAAGVEGSRVKANNTSRQTLQAVRLLTAADTLGLHVAHDVGSATTVTGGANTLNLSAVLLYVPTP